MIDKETSYAMWRWDMWLKGYGSYIEIDRQAKEGALDPSKAYPPKSAEGEARLGPGQVEG